MFEVIKIFLLGRNNSPSQKVKFVMSRFIDNDLYSDKMLVFKFNIIKAASILFKWNIILFKCWICICLSFDDICLNYGNVFLAFLCLIMKIHEGLSINWNAKIKSKQLLARAVTLYIMFIQWNITSRFLFILFRRLFSHSKNKRHVSFLKIYIALFVLLALLTSRLCNIDALKDNCSKQLFKTAESLWRKNPSARI